MEQSYAQYAVEKAVQLLAIDSPTGFTDKAAGWVLEAFASLGFAAQKTTKGGILIDLGGEDSAEGGLLLQAHTDTSRAASSTISSPSASCSALQNICMTKGKRCRAAPMSM